MPETVEDSTLPLVGPWLRPVYFSLGLVSVGLGVAGALLPVMPGIPFFVVGGLLLTRSSARLRGWMLAHPRLGPLVRNYRRRLAVPLRTKIVAIIVTGVVYVGLALLVLDGAAGVAGAVTAWLVIAVAVLMLPTRPRTGAARRNTS